MRRHLGTTRAEARRRPWWEYDLMVEGLLEEFFEPDGSEQVEHHDGSLGSLEELGVNVRRVG